VATLNTNTSGALDAPIEVLLEALALTQYHEKLTTEGYDTVGDLKNAPLEDLMGDCSMKKPHARRVLQHFGKL
jgi:hypothetical protein